MQTVRWKPAEDFLIIGLSDGSVYVWQLETGKEYCFILRVMFVYQVETCIIGTFDGHAPFLA